MSFFYRRAGIIFGLLAIYVLLFGVGVPIELYSGTFVEPAFVFLFGRYANVMSTLGVAALFFFFGSLFLVKSYRWSNRATDFVGLRAVGYSIASFAVAYYFWLIVLNSLVNNVWIMAFFMHPTEEFRRSVSGSEFAYVLEQLLSGALFDALESFQIRITNASYPKDDLVASILTFGMRLTGSFVVASAVLQVFRRPSAPPPNQQK